MRIAVPVGVYRTLETGDQLVSPTVDRPVACRVALPAGDANRQHGDIGGDTSGRAGTAQAGHYPRHGRAVRLQPITPGLLVVAGRRASADDVEAGQHPAVEKRRGGVDGSVEQGHGDSGSPERGEAGRGARRGGVIRARCRSRWKCSPHRKDAGHARRALEQHDGARVGHGGETVDDARELEVGPGDDALRRQLGEELLLARERGRSPAPLFRLRRQTPGLPHAVCQRRILEQNDHALPKGHLGTGSSHEASPG